MTEKILIASDHAGFELKEKLEHALEDLGFDVQDLGTNTADSTDYADYAHPLAEKVSTGEVARGVLLCGTGLGMSYTANRYPRVRAAVAWNPDIAKLARQHNDSNVLALGARTNPDHDAVVRWMLVWLDTPFEGGRHVPRLAKIADYERAHMTKGETPHV